MLPCTAIYPCCFSMSRLHPCDKGEKLVGISVRTWGGGTEKGRGLMVQMGAKVP